MNEAVPKDLLRKIILIATAKPNISLLEPPPYPFSRYTTPLRLTPDCNRFTTAQGAVTERA
jgi:hypothetical protein